MDEKTKLNLGCGIIYRPGYINIDKYEDSIADMIHDVDALPFESNTIHTIEALHLIEHFDYIHSIYVLSEWFRLLKPEGTLILETPDMDKSFKKFKSENTENQKTTIQWLYGIDSPGMQHKTIFTFELLKALLKEIGFQNISREPQKTHKYEHGLRIICTKPSSARAKEQFARFRKNLKKQLKIDDSDSLICLENDCIKEQSYIFFNEFQHDKEKSLNKIIAKCALCNPKISLAFCNTLLESGEITQEVYNSKTGLINYLIKTEFHKKLFTLWSKHKKTIQKTDLNYNTFTGNIKSRLISLLNTSNYQEQLEYISSQKPAGIDIFNLHIIQLESRKLFNQGVKQFHKKNYNESLSLFSESAKLNPQNALTHWNIARIGIVLGYGKENIAQNYENALLEIRNKKTRAIIKKELDTFSMNKTHNIPKEAVSEDMLNL